MARPCRTTTLARGGAQPLGVIQTGPDGTRRLRHSAAASCREDGTGRRNFFNAKAGLERCAGLPTICWDPCTPCPADAPAPAAHLPSGGAKHSLRKVVTGSRRQGGHGYMDGSRCASLPTCCRKQPPVSSYAIATATAAGPSPLVVWRCRPSTSSGWRLATVGAATAGWAGNVSTTTWPCEPAVSDAAAAAYASTSHITTHRCSRDARCFLCS